MRITNYKIRISQLKAILQKVSQLKAVLKNKYITKSMNSYL